jgi:hypothetical protein
LKSLQVVARNGRHIHNMPALTLIFFLSLAFFFDQPASAEGFDWRRVEEFAGRRTLSRTAGGYASVLIVALVAAIQMAILATACTQDNRSRAATVMRFPLSLTGIVSTITPC